LAELVRIARGEHIATRLRTGDAIVLERLSKTYPDGTQAVRELSMRVAAGECYGILGPNGADKSRPSACSPRS